MNPVDDRRTETMREIVVRTVSLDTVAMDHWPALTDLLDERERERAHGFLFEPHRRQFVAAHALKRLLLSSLTGMPPRSWRFESAANGKPQVEFGAGPRFNVSHCDGLVACAVSLEIEVGIDVEPTDRPIPLALAEHHFSAAERRWLADLAEADRQPGFLSIWTLKEAFVKATGRGLAQPLEDFAFIVDPPTIAFSDTSLGEPQYWHFHQSRVEPGHWVAVAWRCENAVVSLASASFDTLL